MDANRTMRKSNLPEMSEPVKAEFQNIASRRTESKAVVDRATIILMAADGETDKTIGAKLGMHVNSVGVWRHRIVDDLPRLNAIAEEAPDKLHGAVEKLLRDRPRPGAPQVYDTTDRALVVKLACTPPTESGIERKNWTPGTLKLVLDRDDMLSGKSMSTATINRVLDEVDVHPHRNQYWLHSTEKYDDPISWYEKVRDITEIYRLGQIIYSFTKDGTCEADIEIRCGDESPFQVLGDKYEPKPCIPGTPTTLDYEYIRQGTTGIIGFFNPVNGRLDDPFLKATHKEPDFVEAFGRVVETAPGKRWVFVLDNLNTHCSESLVIYVAEKSGLIPGLIGVARPEEIDQLCKLANMDQIVTKVDLEMLEKVANMDLKNGTVDFNLAEGLCELKSFMDLMVSQGFTPNRLDLDNIFTPDTGDDGTGAGKSEGINVDIGTGTDAGISSDTGSGSGEGAGAGIDAGSGSGAGIDADTGIGNDASGGAEGGNESPNPAYGKLPDGWNLSFSKDGFTLDFGGALDCLQYWNIRQNAIKEALGVKGCSGILKSMASRSEFLSDRSHRIRIVYTPKHCSWMNQIEIWFGVLQKQLLRRHRYPSVKEMEESVRRYVEQYNRFFAHPYNWTYDPDKKAA